MYKMIIADDEKVIRRGLVDLIPWDELGFSMEADFEDGREAIEYLSHHDVHVVLTDVRMTEVDGLELAKWVHEHKPHVKVIIISGYKEFDYARLAMQYNVSRYLLKPTNIDEIESVFKEVKHELTIDDRDLAERRRSQEWLPLLRDQFFTDLLMGALRGPGELARRIESIGLPFAEDDGCCVADIRMEPRDGANLNKADERDRWIAGMSRLLKQQDDGEISFYPVSNSELGFKAIGVWDRRLGAQSGRRLAEKQLEQLIESARAIYTFGIEASIEQEFGTLAELAGHSDKVRLTLPEPGGKVRLEGNEYARLVTKYKLFISNVVEGNTAEVSSLMDRFLEEFREAPADFTHRLIRDLFAIIQHTLGRGRDDMELLTGKVLNYDMASGGLDEIWSLSRHTVTEVMETISTAKGESSKLLIDQAKQLIQERYWEDLSLDQVADHVFLHPVYFSKLFKQHAGINFSEYLTRVRIDKAKELIRIGRYKMYEVGSMVGYPNSKYFYRVFKQTVGCTPMAYAESANGEKGVK